MFEMVEICACFVRAAGCCPPSGKESPPVEFRIADLIRRKPALRARAPARSREIALSRRFAREATNLGVVEETQ